MLFGNGKTSSPKATYNGDRSIGALVEFVSKHGGNSLKIKEIKTQSDFESVCDSSKSVCFLGFLPSLEESTKAEREKYVKVIKGIASDSVELPIKFGWIEGKQINLLLVLYDSMRICNFHYLLLRGSSFQF